MSSQAATTPAPSRMACLDQSLKELNTSLETLEERLQVKLITLIGAQPTKAEDNNSARISNVPNGQLEELGYQIANGRAIVHRLHILLNSFDDIFGA